MPSQQNQLKHNGRNSPWIWIFMGCLFVSLFTAPQFLNSLEEEENKINDDISKRNSTQIIPQGAIVHEPIFIDLFYDDEAGYSAITGNGTLENPYLIQNLFIDAGGIGSGIYIEIRKYVRIENCTIINSGSAYMDAGIKLFYAQYVNVTNCTFTSNFIGIYSFLSQNCQYDNNTISESRYMDFYAYYEENGVFTDNTFTEKGIFMRWTTNVDLDTTNTVNGLPIYYYENQIGLDLNGSEIDRGQVILVNCTFSTLYNFNISNRGVGICLDHSNNITLFDNILRNNSYAGIAMHESTNNTLYNNTFEHCGLDIESGFNHNITQTNLVNGKPLLLYYNTTDLELDGNIEDNIGQLILYNCNNSNIANYNISYSQVGVTIISSHNVSLANMTLEYNINTGIEIQYSSHINITQCQLNNNTLNGIHMIGLKRVSDYPVKNHLFIQNNTCNGNIQEGFRFAFIDNLTVLNNTLKFNGVGIDVAYVNNSILEDNIISYNRMIGLDVIYSVNGTVANNSLTTNGGFGINFEHLEDYNLSRNTFLECTFEIELSTCADTEIDEFNTVDGLPILYLHDEFFFELNGLTADPFNHLIVNGGLFLTLKNLNISEDQTKIDIYGVNTLRIEDSLFSNNIQSMFIIEECEALNIIANQIINNKGDGLYLKNVNGGSIDDNQIRSNTGAGINHYSSENCEFENNTISYNGKAGITVYPSGDNVIRNNTLSYNELDGAYVGGSPSVTITENVIFGNHRNGIFFDDYNYNGIIENNTITSNSHHGIHIYDFNPNLGITDNLVNGNGLNGILVNISEDHSIIHNNVSLNGQRGIAVIESNDSTIEENQIWWNNWEGLVISDAANEVVENNSIIDNGLEGIVSSVNNSQFVGNLILNNSIDLTSAQYVDTGTDNTWTGNIVDGNYDGDLDELGLYYELAIYWTDPENNDTDEDLLLDGFEATYGTNPNSNDTDGDLLEDGDEILVYLTNATNPDTDGDNLNDYDELIVHFTNASATDTDGDTLNDYDELFTHFTNATNPDSDGDTYNDDIELAAATDPNDPLDFPTDPDPTTITPTDGTTHPNGGEEELPLEFIIGGGIVGTVAFLGLVMVIKKRK